MIHLSDIFRIAVLYRYGGWYSDLDTVTIAKSNHLKNTVALASDFVANGNLIFDSGHPFLNKLMAQAEKTFTGRGWNSLGPVLLTNTLIEECDLHRNIWKDLVGRHRPCGNITILSHPSFYPFRSSERAQLFDEKKDTFWERKFRRSYSVHFYGQITSGRGWQTGNHTAYDYLGRMYCPNTYSLQGNMDLYSKGKFSSTEQTTLVSNK